MDRFVLLFALAWGGGTIAYVPLLTILLPMQVEGLAGKAAGVDWLAFIALAGAVAASLGGIAFGYLSDITRNRRGWILAGLVLSNALLVLIGKAQGLSELILCIVLWQLALNMMLCPLVAWAGDVVPDFRKGLLGGLMAFAPAFGALSGAIITQPGLATSDARLWLVTGLVVLCVVPILLVRSPPALATQPPPNREGATSGSWIKPVYGMWLARLAVQIAESTLFAYLYFWLVSLDSTVSDNLTARLFGAVMLASAPLALAAGRWSDRYGRPIAPLQVCALASAFGLAVMAVSDSLGVAMLAYGLFGLSSSVFLALHTTQILRILPRPDRRGRDLGLFNLANTFPSLVMPWLAIALIPAFGYPGLFLLLALLASSAWLLLRPTAAGR